MSIFLKLSFLFLSFSMIFSCTDPQTANSDKATSVYVDTSIMTIIPYDHESLYWLFDSVRPATLNDSELVVIEEILLPAVEDYNVQIEKEMKEMMVYDSLAQWDAGDYQIFPGFYCRQYVPIFNSKGEKEVWINFFCCDHELISDDWKKHLVMVNDGGNCYVNLKINLSTGKCYDIYVNGYA